ncbi:2-dehydropantoate 2-reductase [Drechslerella dactyloides]|uniref:2-dehydropantoate 2-reductase n=1 Tax=Drechslerella dactyloides TaxID=74499 RepID=A0AAD6IXI9_DREDA|nr:2-dehydropantoate 2-reductase [Drechslerella dactyloides]
MSAPEVLIFGAGAVGAFYGSRLAHAGAPVSAVCRSNYAAVKASGFSIASPQFGEYSWTPTRVFPSAAEAVAAGVRWSFIVVTTKALPDVSDDSALLDGLVGPGTAIVLVQNGLGVEEPYRQRFPHAAILSAVTVVSASQPSPGRIDHNRWTRINIGPFLPDVSDGEETHAATAQAREFARLLVAGGVKDASAYSHRKLQQVRWHKIAINASFNPSSVLSNGTSNRAMAEDPELAEHVRGVMDEVLTTAPKVLGAPFPAEFASADSILASTRRNVSGSRPSMWGDWEAGRPMEIEVIIGNPIRLARAKGLEMPRMQTLYALIKMAQANRDALRKSQSRL